MLFDKKIEPSCAYCLKGVPLNDSEVACSRKGIVSPGGSCKKFKYDPLKRLPPKPVLLKTDSVKKEDFIL